jgi:transposase-like protein
MTIEVPIASIRLDGGTQPRAALDFAAVDDYSDAMVAGAKFPAVILYHDGEHYWLADGFHRVKAAFQAGAENIEAEVRQGSLEDAQWHSFSANKTNGLRRTNDDKQRAVKAALSHPRGADLSDSQIAKHVGVHHDTVREWRAKLESSCGIRKMPARKVTRKGKTYQQDTTRIGRSRSPKQDSGELPEVLRVLKDLAGADPEEFSGWVVSQADSQAFIQILEKANAFITEVLEHANQPAAVD